MNPITKNPVYSIEQLSSEYLNQKKSQTTVNRQNAESSFREILQAKAYAGQRAVAFSKHASERLDSRNIQLTDAQVQRLNQGVEQARGKNINESLVMLDNLAFIVNVKNNTVVTALDRSNESGHVFTNIDGAVIV